MHPLPHSRDENSRRRKAGDRQQLRPHLHQGARLRRFRSRRDEHTARKRPFALQCQDLRDRHCRLHCTAAREPIERQQRIVSLAVLAEKLRQRGVTRRTRAVPHFDGVLESSALLKHARKRKPRGRAAALVADQLFPHRQGLLPAAASFKKLRPSHQQPQLLRIPLDSLFDHRERFLHRTARLQ